jgi:hypothetical protein
MGLLIVGALGAAILAGQPLVHVIATPDPPVAQAANALLEALREQTGIGVAKEVALAQPQAQEQVDLSVMTELVDSAHEAYIALSPKTALKKAALARAKLSLGLDHAPAVAELARALRIMGLIHLYEQQQDRAAAAFVSAHVLTPEYKPTANDWPPEARKAYREAINTAESAARGVLSIEVEPKAADVWLDGQHLGTGPTPAPDLLSGEHLLLATCPGYGRVGAVVTVTGGGKLNQAALFLEPKPGAQARLEQVAALPTALNTEAEAALVQLVEQQLDADALVVVVGDADAEGQSVVWLFDNKGERLGDAIRLAEGTEVAAEVRRRVLDEKPPQANLMLNEAIPPVVEPPMWYERWEVWLVIGSALAVATGTTIYIATSQGQGKRPVTIVIGK